MTIERSTTQRAMPRNRLRHTGWLLLLLVAACATRPAALEHRPYDVAQASGWQAEVDAAARLPAEALPDPVLDTALAMIERFSADHAVDRQRLYVVGFSMGASAAWNAMAKRPDLFAAGVPISGIPPSAASAAALAPLPILIVHGTADTENEIGPDRVMYRALIGQGAARVRMREYDGLDHRIATELFASDTGWRNWLFAQRRR